MVRAKTMELDAALAWWVASEQSLEAMARSSNKRGAEYTAEGSAVALKDDYLAAARALGVFIEAATQPSVTMKQHALG